MMATALAGHATAMSGRGYSCSKPNSVGPVDRRDNSGLFWYLSETADPPLISDLFQSPNISHGGPILVLIGGADPQPFELRQRGQDAPQISLRDGGMGERLHMTVMHPGEPITQGTSFVSQPNKERAAIVL